MRAATATRIDFRGDAVRSDAQGPSLTRTSVARPEQAQFSRKIQAQTATNVTARGAGRYSVDVGATLAVWAFLRGFVPLVVARAERLAPDFMQF
jgi:hypothetical protein